jgi:hypothetical protein
LQEDSYYYFSLAVWVFDAKVVPQFKEILQQYFKANFDNVWYCITSQTEITTEQTFRVELATLKKRYGNLPPQKNIEHLQKKYRYL